MKTCHADIASGTSLSDADQKELITRMRLLRRVEKDFEVEMHRNNATESIRNKHIKRTKAITEFAG